VQTCVMTLTQIFIMRALRTVRIVLRDGRIPKPIRWGGALALLPVPGPLDEAVLLRVGCLLWLFYRQQFAEAWSQSTTVASSDRPTPSPASTS
jgi:hypothetical protein